MSQVSLLPYCVALNHSETSGIETGVCYAEVNTMVEGNLLALYSELQPERLSANEIQKEAIQFHRVVHAVFAHRAVIPFRFPTWLTRDELAQHLRERQAAYSDFLQKHAANVQIEFHLTMMPESGTLSATTGTEYLRSRSTQSQAIREYSEHLRVSLRSSVLEWRQRDAPSGTRLYALVPREVAQKLKDLAAALATPEKIVIRTTGPWPATEFLPN